MSSPGLRGKMTATSGKSGKTQSIQDSSNVSSSLRACPSPNSGLVVDSNSDSCASPFEDNVKETFGGGRIVYTVEEDDTKPALILPPGRDSDKPVPAVAIELQTISKRGKDESNGKNNKTTQKSNIGDSSSGGSNKITAKHKVTTVIERCDSISSSNNNNNTIQNTNKELEKVYQETRGSTPQCGCNFLARNTHSKTKNGKGVESSQLRRVSRTNSAKNNTNSKKSDNETRPASRKSSLNQLTCKVDIQIQNVDDESSSRVLVSGKNSNNNNKENNNNINNHNNNNNRTNYKDDIDKRRVGSITSISSEVVVEGGNSTRRKKVSREKSASSVTHLTRVPLGKRYEDYFQIEEKDEEEFGRKPRWFKPRLKYYLSEMGCGTSNQVVSMEGKMPIVVFGATGVVGGSVVRALLKDPRFSVRAVTRTPTTDEARALAELGAVVVPADLNDSRSLQRVMDGAAGVFLTTSYWEHLSKQKELTHGMNAIDAAASCNVHHFIFQGSDHTREGDKPCGHMNSKAAIEEYIKETQIPYTAVHLPFLYENLFSLFKPHCVQPGLYTLPIPLGDVAVDCMALHDLARCVINIFLRPKNHMMKSVDLTGDRMTAQHMVEVLNRHFDDRKFVYHTMTPEDFASFDFQGSQDLAAMFEYLQSSPHRDPRITRRIHHSVVCFDKWVADNKQKLVDAMKDTGEDG